MSEFIPYGRQDIAAEDIEAVVRVLKSEFLTQGPEVDAFEKAVAERCQAKYAVAVSSATAGLHLACLALGVKSGSRVWTSPITFVASSNAVLYCGGRPDFVDIDPDSWNISHSELERRLQGAPDAGQLPQVVIPVHFSGLSSDMERIAELSRRYGFRIIEDASHAIGGVYHQQPVGSCAFSDLCVFSFHPVKIMTTGEGGVVTTNDPELYARISRLRSHGITREVARMTEPSHGDWYYQQLELGFNYRLTDIQAVLGSNQLRRLTEFVARRNELADRYDRLLSGLPLQLPVRQEGVLSSFHLYVVRIRPNANVSRKEVFRRLREASIGVNVHYIPVPMQPYYRNLGYDMRELPESARYYEEAITLPLFSAMSFDQQDRVAETLRGCF